MNKPQLRQLFRQRRAEISASQAQRAARRVANHLFSTPELAGARGVLTCLSFGRELDTWNLVTRLQDAGKAVFVPRVERRSRRLHVHPYPCPLETLSFGLRQPPAGEPSLEAAVINDTIDLVLVLGLAFDRAGYRLGHGGGYFDRFLARRALPAIGLGHHFQLVETLPHEAHDVPMHAVVTEEGVWRPASPPGPAIWSKRGSTT